MKEIIDKAVRGGLKKGELWKIHCGDKDSVYVDILIFSHKFLKAYFGECGENTLICGNDGGRLNGAGKNTTCTICGRFGWEVDFIQAWQYHAQQLVLSEDRRGYLRRYL